MRSKISVIGAGNVGATVAQFIALKDLGDVYLFDVFSSTNAAHGIILLLPFIISDFPNFWLKKSLNTSNGSSIRF